MKYIYLLQEVLGKYEEKLDRAGDTINYFTNNKTEFLIMLLIVLLLIILGIIVLALSDDSKKRRTILEKELYIKEKSDIIPCKGDLYVTYFVASKCNLVDYLSIKGNLISSFYLKWIKKGLLKIDRSDEKDKQAILFFDDNFISCIDDEIEAELYTITKKILNVSKANYFKADDLVNVLSNDQVGITSFFIKVYDKGKKRAYAEVVPIPDKSGKVNNYIFIQHIIELKTEIIKFMNYINNIDVLSDYEFEAVKLWDNLYIFANLLGLRKKVKSGRFKNKVNPNLIKLENTHTFENINNFIHNHPLYGDEEYKNNKKKIIKSQKMYKSDLTDK